VGSFLAARRIEVNPAWAKEIDGGASFFREQTPGLCARTDPKSRSLCGVSRGSNFRLGGGGDRNND